MKNIFLLVTAIFLLAGCKEKNKQDSSKKTEKNSTDSKYIISKDGIGEIKIGMTRKEVERILNESLVMRHAKDTGEIWSDTAIAKYGEIEVELAFQKIYAEKPTDEMELYGISTSSTLCKTASGLGVGDDRLAILTAYEENPITMGPENIMINDTTWGFSKTNYYIHISDEKWDRQIGFILVNKKVAKLEAILHMGD